MEEQETAKKKALAFCMREYILPLREEMKAALTEIDRMLEGLSSGRMIGTDAVRGGENAKRYAHQIQIEVREYLSKFSTPPPEKSEL